MRSSEFGFQNLRKSYLISGFGLRGTRNLSLLGTHVLEKGLGFRVLGFGFGVSGSGFRDPGFGFRVPNLWFRVLGSGSTRRRMPREGIPQSLNQRVQNPSGNCIRVQTPSGNHDLGFGVSGLGYRGWSPEEESQEGASPSR